MKLWERPKQEHRGLGADRTKTVHPRELAENLAAPYGPACFPRLPLVNWAILSAQPDAFQRRGFPMNILFVYPKVEETFWSFRHALHVAHRKAAFPPLGAL